MARFYQTAQRNYQDDFIFQPNWEMATMALSKRDSDIKEQLDTLDLFRNLPIDYWKDADSDNVEQIKNEYESRVEEITRQMQSDLLNTGNNRYSINQLRRDIEKDYEFGKIRQIQDNAEAYRQFKSNLDALPNPMDRQGYMAMVDNYLLNNEQGALSNIFTPDEMYNNRDVWAEFTSSDAFKSLKPDEQASEITTTNGRYFVTEGGRKVELSESKIGQAFNAFINSSNLQGYGADRQKYFGQNWMDEEGNVKMDSGSYLGSILETGIPSLAYRNSATSRGMSVDQYGVLSQQEAMQIRAEKRAAHRQRMEDNTFPPEMSKNAQFAARTSSQVVDIVNDKMQKLGERYGIKLDASDLDNMILEAKEKNYNTFAQELINLQTSLNEGLRASYEPLYAMGYDKNYVEAFKKNVQTGIELKGDNVKGYADFTTIGIPAKNTISKNLSPNELIGRTVGDRKIRDVGIVKNSSFPVFFGTSDLVNQVQSTLKIEFEPRVDANGNIIDEEESNIRYVDFYQPSREISGDNTIKQDYINANN